MRIRVIRSVLLPAVAAALLLAGCSDEGGTPSATDTGQPSSPATQPSSPASGSGLDGLVACDLLTAEDVKQFGVTTGGKDAGAIGGTGTSGCDWQKPFTGGEGGFGFGLTIRPSQSIESVVQEEGWTKRPAKFAGRDAVVIMEQRQSAASCMLALAVGTNARVDVSANGGDTTKEMCDLAADVATIVEPKLPKDGG